MSVLCWLWLHALVPTWLTSHVNAAIKPAVVVASAIAAGSLGGIFSWQIYWQAGSPSYASNSLLYSQKIFRPRVRIENVDVRINTSTTKNNNRLVAIKSFSDDSFLKQLINLLSLDVLVSYSILHIADNVSQRSPWLITQQTYSISKKKKQISVRMNRICVFILMALGLLHF